jgi:hypothetical protein
MSEFMQRCKEIEFDAVADNGEVIAYAISEHIEFAGVHSGDATIQFPPQKLYVETVRRIKKIAKKIAAALEITGPFNIQFLAKDNYIKVIECNLRASRSFPFVSKVLKINMIELATKAMLGLKPSAPRKSAFDLDYVMDESHCTVGVPKCDCCGGIVKPDVVLYEEPLDSDVIEGAVDAISRADTLIIGGTSLAVYPAASFIHYFRGDKVVLINKSKTINPVRVDLEINEPIGQVLGDVTGV